MMWSGEGIISLSPLHVAMIVADGAWVLALQEVQGQLLAQLPDGCPLGEQAVGAMIGEHAGPAVLGHHLSFPGDAGIPESVVLALLPELTPLAQLHELAEVAA